MPTALSHPQYRRVVLLVLSTFLLIAAVYLLLPNRCNVVSAASCVQSIEQSSSIAPQYYWYTQQNVEAAIASQKKVVLFFYAPWCGTCSTLDDELQKESEQLNDNLTVLRVRYDTDTYMKRKYGVITQHTLVLVDEEQQAIRTWVGGGIDEINRQTSD